MTTRLIYTKDAGSRSNTHFMCPVKSKRYLDLKDAKITIAIGKIWRKIKEFVMSKKLFRMNKNSSSTRPLFVCIVFFILVSVSDRVPKVVDFYFVTWRHALFTPKTRVHAPISISCARLRFRQYVLTDSKIRARWFIRLENVAFFQLSVAKFYSKRYLDLKDAKITIAIGLRFRQ
jgi:hypothetical protein